MGTIVSSLVFLALVGAIAANIVFVFRNAYVQELLTMGWGPLFAAMAISRCVLCRRNRLGFANSCSLSIE